METVLLVTITILVLTVLHELGHVAAAKALNLRIFKVGALLRPFPHLFVAVGYPKVFWKKFIYLMAGSAVTLSLLLICFLSGQLVLLKWLSLAFAYQIIMETNPFYSDFTIITGIPTDDYLFTKKWYIHFFAWMCIIIVIIKMF